MRLALGTPAAAPADEAEMAELGCALPSGRAPRRVLIGGLGFGFTLRRVLEESVAAG